MVISDYSDIITNSEIDFVKTKLEHTYLEIKVLAVKGRSRIPTGYCQTFQGQKVLVV